MRNDCPHVNQPHHTPSDSNNSKTAKSFNIRKKVKMKLSYTAFYLFTLGLSLIGCARSFDINGHEHPIAIALDTIQGKGLWLADLLDEVGLLFDESSFIEVYDFADVLDEGTNSSVCAKCRVGLDIIVIDQLFDDKDVRFK